MRPWSFRFFREICSHKPVKMMKKYAVAVALTLAAAPVCAQTDRDERREDRKEQQDERKAANKDRVDTTEYRRQ